MEDRTLPDHSYTHPRNAPLDDGRGVDPSTGGSCLVDADIFFDWDALYGVQANSVTCSTEDLGVSWSTFDSLPSNAPSPIPLFEPAHLFDEPTILTQPEALPESHVGGTARLPSNFNNVSEWLDGAYRPATPCDHCRRYRLQCLILRSTPYNPNPIPSCSSCVGLFRPCSFGRGEKRQASGFETLSPVLGHLHGLPEEADGSAGINSEIGSGFPHGAEPKDSKRFVRKGARVLRDWFYRNEDCPYPSEAEKSRLAQETGFSRQRVSTWFANARRRYKQQRQVDSSTRVYRAGSPMPTRDPALMSPMERWQASPPDEEPVSEAAIHKAIASTSAGSDASSHKSPFDSHSTDLSSGVGASSMASSLSSFNATQSDASDSGSSAWSYRSQDGPLRRRPYHRRLPAGRPGGRKRVLEDGRYQCTFCMQSFKKKHDWSRHERTVHLPLDVWICTPNLSELEPVQTPFLECRCCDCQSLDPDHWESHDFRECATKSLDERSFSRKDHLWQHLRKFHGCTRYPVRDLDAWRAPRNEIQSRCGFCAALLPGWTARADHLATHFKEGCRMSQWVGDWGFDGTVLAHLRNAVVPMERNWVSPASHDASGSPGLSSPEHSQGA
ncbi:homeobox domain-containing protein [Aspergillus lucknowensis]|uniref:Homeobox and C2H2 transcription factor n=1 Tax=Aspergillus lucknowensis TaxID=176173 RepID=A0ABR4LCT5_9EURO